MPKAKFAEEASRKYELMKSDRVKIEGVNLYRIRALKDIGDDVKKDDLGGYVRSEKCLAHAGNCWIYDDAKATGVVSGNATMRKISELHGGALQDEAVLLHKAVAKGSTIGGTASVGGDTNIMNSTIINVKISGDSFIIDSQILSDEEMTNVTVVNNCVVREVGFEQMKDEMKQVATYQVA